MSSLITQRLITYARKEFYLDWDGIVDCSGLAAFAGLMNP